jgi:hypothetical protein
MMSTKKICTAALAAVCLVSGLSWATTQAFSPVLPPREPAWVFTAGPGTVLSVRLRDLPFIKPQYIVKFKTDEGQLIEVRLPQLGVPVVEGMHGTLIYCTHPDRIVTFRIAMSQE